MMVSQILQRGPNACNFVEWRGWKLVYRRYAALYFIVAQDYADNELIGLELIKLIVKTMDLYFGSVCELDLIFNFDKASFIVSEALVAGFLCEPSHKSLLESVVRADVEEDPNLIQTLDALDGLTLPLNPLMALYGEK